MTFKDRFNARKQGGGPGPNKLIITNPAPMEIRPTIETNLELEGDYENLSSPVEPIDDNPSSPTDDEYIPLLREAIPNQVINNIENELVNLEEAKLG